MACAAVVEAMKPTLTVQSLRVGTKALPAGREPRCLPALPHVKDAQNGCHE